MEDTYRKYYLTDDVITSMIDGALVVFDASALLELYCYSDSTQEQITTTVFDFLCGRLWMPAQAQFEYLKNKNKVANKAAQSYRSLIDPSSGDGGHGDKIKVAADKFGTTELDTIKSQLKTLIEKTSKEDKHPFFPIGIYADLDVGIQTIEQHIGAFRQTVQIFKDSFQSAIDEKISALSAKDDVIQERISEKFQFGPEMTYSEMTSIATEGVFRYQEEIPPGYADAKQKIGMQKFGDLFIWKQILQYAQKAEKDVLLITNDVKPDWYDRELDAPRYELLKEFHSATGHSFWSLKMSRFLYLINKKLSEETQIPESVIDEVSSFRPSSKDFATGDECWDMLQGLLFEEDDCIQIIDEHTISADWRVFGSVRLFEGIGSSGDRYMIILNIINERIGYAKTIHALRNAFEIKSQLEAQGLTYTYRMVALTPSRESAERMGELAESRPNTKKLFQRDEIWCDFGYLAPDGEFVIVDANHAVG